MRPAETSLTHFRRHKFHRDLAIYLAWRGGMSGRSLSLAFLLSRARVGEILAELREVAESRGETGGGRSVSGCGGAKGCGRCPDRKADGESRAG